MAKGAATTTTGRAQRSPPLATALPPSSRQLIKAANRAGTPPTNLIDKLAPHNSHAHNLSPRFHR